MQYIYYTEDLRILLAFAGALFITFILIPSIIDIARAKSFVAIPNGRTSHTISTPTLGGIAIFIGAVFSDLIFLNGALFYKFQYLFAAFLIIFFIGFKDDIIGISPFKKFIGQLMAALIIIEFGHVSFTHLHGLMGFNEISYSFGLVLSVITIVGVTNCFNLMDGIDGLSGSLGVLSAAAFGTWFYLAGEYDMAVISASLLGALMGFLYFNVFGKKNKIFMGDTGSLLLGFIMSILVIEFNEISVDVSGIWAVPAAPAISVGILMVPVFDTLRVFATRIFRNKAPFNPDKTHIHHHLLELGFSHIQATLTLVAVTLVFIAVSWFLRNLTVFNLVVILLVLAAGFSAIPIILVSRKKRNAMKKGLSES